MRCGRDWRWRRSEVEAGVWLRYQRASRRTRI